MPQLRLSDPDRERFGVGEWLDYDFDRMSMVEAETLQERFGVDPEDRYTWLRGEPVIKAGDPVNDDEGNPVYRRPLAVYRFLVWQALRRAGVHVDAVEFDFDYSSAAYARRDEEPGKDPPDPSTPTGTSDS